jgi:hypothetical protein
MKTFKNYKEMKTFKNYKEMKNRRIYAFFVLLLFFSFNLAAIDERSTDREFPRTMYSESRFVDRFANSTPTPAPIGENGGLPPGGGGRPNPKDALNPIGDAVWLVLLFGLLYGVSLYKRKRAIRNR